MNAIGMHLVAAPPPPPPIAPSTRIKTIIFDLMGTLLDWHTSISRVLQDRFPRFPIPEDSDANVAADSSAIALEWRKAFFSEIHRQYESGSAPEDIDQTHRRTLRMVLDRPEWAHRRYLAGNDEEAIVQAWHDQVAWRDVENALPRLREGFEV